MRSLTVFSVVVAKMVTSQMATAQAEATDKPARSFTRVAMIESIPQPRLSGAHLIQLNDKKDIAAVAMYGCKTVFWNLKTNAAIGEPTQQSGDAGAIGFIPNSNLAYTADWDSMQVWNPKTGLKTRRGFPHRLREDSVLAPAISPNGKTLVTRNQMNSLRFWNLETQQAIGPVHTHDSVVQNIQFSSDNKWLFSKAGSLNIWNPMKGELAAESIQNNIYATAYLPAGQYLATFEHDRNDPSSKSEVMIRSGAADWKVVRQFEIPGRARRAEWIDQYRLMIVGTEVGEKFKTVGLVVHLNQLAPKFDVVFNSEVPINDYVFTKDRQHLVTISNRKVSCWRIGDTQPKWERKWIGKHWRKQVFCTDSDWVMAHGLGENAIAYSIEDGAELWRKREVIYANTDGKHILVTSKDGAEVWQWAVVKTGKKIE